MLQQRLLTALILIPLILCAIMFLHPLTLLGITTAIILWASWEWSKLLPLKTHMQRGGYVLCVALSLILTARVGIEATLYFGIVFWCFAGLSVVMYKPSTKKNRYSYLQNAWVRAFTGIAVLAPAWLAFNQLRVRTDGIYWLIILLVLVWAADSVAYFTGRQWGKTKLLPHVSPKKTWEGLYGAFFGVMLVGVFEVVRSPRSFEDAILWFTLLVLVFVFSVVGDLFESLQKRWSGAKDSGSLLPGHGGVLDRLDSLFAVLPLYALFLLNVGWVR